jgi:hypothetical protein
MSLTFRSPLDAMRLHCHVSIQVIQGAIGLFAAIPAALVHSLNFLVSTTRSLVLLRARNRNKGVNLESILCQPRSIDRVQPFKPGVSRKNPPKLASETERERERERER